VQRTVSCHPQGKSLALTALGVKPFSLRDLDMSAAVNVLLRA
jgi:hypothetical protein